LERQRFWAAALATVALVVLSAPGASATDIEDLYPDFYDFAPDSSDYLYGLIPDGELQFGEGPFGTEDLDDFDAGEASCRAYDPDEPEPLYQKVPYGEFIDDDSGNPVALVADIYPASTPGVEAAMIMIYGGGWKKGCRRNVISVANDMKDQGFTVVAIDHRMACDEDEEKPPGEVNYRCDYHANGNPPDYDDPIYQDVLQAVLFGRGSGDLSIADYDSRLPGPNNPVVVLGFSSGGNLALMAGTNGDPATASLPDAVGAWSGPTELAYIQTGETACSKAWHDQMEDKRPECASSRNNYVDCDFYIGFNVEPPIDPACEPPFDQASPYYWAEQRIGGTPGDIAPAFLANAIDELTPDEEAKDFFTLVDPEVPATDLCLVGDPRPGHENDPENHRHATGLKDEQCRDQSTGQAQGKVENRTVSFFIANT
jgi:acetyl esterase/lipase